MTPAPWPKRATAAAVAASLILGLAGAAALTSEGLAGDAGKERALARREFPDTGDSEYEEQKGDDEDDQEVSSDRREEEDRSGRDEDKYFSYPDIEDADSMCGPLSLVTTCGFEDQEPFCFEEVGGERCYRGICICNSESGECLDPICSTPPADNVCPGPPCADESKCISSQGRGWSCWHPCNWKHREMDYGRDAAPIVEKIRTTGRCKDLVDTDEIDPGLDAGLRLAAHGTVVGDLGGWSGEYAGGSSRRRAGKIEGESNGAAPRAGAGAAAAALAAVASGRLLCGYKVLA